MEEGSCAGEAIGVGTEVSYLEKGVTFAVAGDEWINGDQKGELFEALAEFSHCRRSSFRQRVPA